MSDQFTDNFNVPITYLSTQQVESADSSPIIVKVPAVALAWLSADDDAYVRVRARRNGTADPYVDLATDPIDLTPYDGTTAVFDLVIRTEAVADPVVSRAVQVRRTFNP